MKKNLLKTIWTIALLITGYLVYCQPGGGGGNPGGGPPPGSVGAPIDQLSILFLVGVAGYSYYSLKEKKTV